MNKIKIPIFASILVILIISPSSAFAAKVNRVNIKRRLVSIDEGKINGYIKKEVVCFYEISGANIGCGKIKRSSLYKSQVRVSIKLINKIKIGQKAKLKNEAKKNGFQPPKFAFKLIINPTLISHIRYNKIAYLPPEAGVESVETLWDKSDGPKFAPITFSLAGNFMRYRTSLGIRGKLYRGLESKSDYIIANDEFLSTKITSNSYAIYFEIAAFRTNSLTRRQFALNLGIDYEYSMAAIKGTKESYDSGQSDVIYSAKSKLYVLSLRVAPELYWVFNSSIISIGLNVLIPFSATNEFTIDESDDENKHKVNDPEKDLKDRFDHNTNSLGIELAISYSIPF